MSLGDSLLKLRKKAGLSQEELAEKIDVTRQTISNWELNETQPNPEQLKLLSHIFNISIDDLLDNDIRSSVEEKISNTEKLAGIIIKILKVFGVLIIMAFIIDIVAFILFLGVKKDDTKVQTTMMEMSCSIEDDNYIIEVLDDGKFSCDNCSKEMYETLKNNHVFKNDMEKTENSISDYFMNNNGTCE